MKEEGMLLKLPTDGLVNILTIAGYKPHKTIYKSEEKNGYIRIGLMQKRFHLFISKDGVRVHVDKTIKGRHKVVSDEYNEYLQKELKRIRAIWKQYDPNYRKNMENIYPSRKERRLKNEERKRKGFKDISLPHGEIKEKLRKLKQYATI